ncbi:MAG: DEAD/DEAH box helicase [Candidatus Eremiobacteraeota bacterium]|nr:DEAD/DEAH box helicase [Candidatus Eremiobacteraeota bacterium]
MPTKPNPSNRPRPPSATKGRRLPPPTASEAALERLLAHFEDAENDVGDGTETEKPAPSDDAVFLAELFSKREAFLVRDRFASIGEADDFYTKVVGVSFEGRQGLVTGLAPGDPLELVREPENPHDPNTLAVRYGRFQLGYVRREIARRISPNVDGGDRYSAVVGSITGGGERNIGVNIRVRRTRANAPEPLAARAGARSAGAADTGALLRALIGERPLREAQASVLARLATGANLLAVLGTGRGKSLCFQLPAAERALARGEKTIVFYPLRALTNDQYEAMTRRLDGFGLRVLRANGAIDGGERAELDAALDDGSWDVILSTPEFATYHRDAFLRACNRPAFVVVDEAHHIFESNHRAAYGTLGTLVRELGARQVLALTATANAEAFAAIRRALAIESWVIDPTIRENLHVFDARNTTDKNAYLARELGEGKAIVYCNSRAEVAKLAERLRARIGDSVAFYHAGVPGPERLRVEDLFRRGVVRTIVATSAFGEGIDLPDVRNVVLYHLNFDFTEFNQMAGRAGRDGEPARIHLLYGDSDRRINDFIIARSAPSLEVLRELYRGMRRLVTTDVLRMTHEDVARTLELDMIDGSTVAAAVRIFAEAGLADAGVDDDGRFVRFVDVAEKVDLTKTARFAEGQAERDAFERFCGLALGADAKTLEQIVNRPIYPDRIALEA